MDTYDYYKEHLVDLGEDDSYDPTDYDDAITKILEGDKEYMGVLYKDPTAESYSQAHGLTEDMTDLSDWPPEGAQKLVNEFY